MGIVVYSKQYCEKQYPTVPSEDKMARKRRQANKQKEQICIPACYRIILLCIQIILG